MILRPSPPAAPPASTPRPAWQAFQETQSAADPPHVVLQPDHAVLAGEIAACLLPDAFGELPQEVVDTIGRHDSGWRDSDEAQLNAPRAAPQPFLAVAPEVSAACWTASVRNAERVSPLAGILTARHFCAVAQDTPPHRAFVAAETPRIQAAERQLELPAGAVARWTAALGFCDLLSLYLCCGTSAPAVFPLAHPALPDARHAPTAVLQWRGGRPSFTGGVIEPGAIVSVEAVEWSGRLRVKLAWEFL